mmetsp:Transcript_3405/g.6555  ORF Transcript_3405/g.6555 Transcript_3405/m.6555 type:complete len:120 (+) Transcript_3405:2008-2367(+)
MPCSQGSRREVTNTAEKWHNYDTKITPPSNETIDSAKYQMKKTPTSCRISKICDQIFSPSSLYFYVPSIISFFLSSLENAYENYNTKMKEDWKSALFLGDANIPTARVAGGLEQRPTVE